MRICHVSDSHLGAGELIGRRGMSGFTERQDDIIRSFEESIDKIIALSPDICLHSGDLFHQVRPSNRLLALVGHQLHRLADQAGIPTVIIAGNHDSPRQPHVGAALDVFAHIRNLFVVAGSELRRFQFDGANVWALPHCISSDVLTGQLALCVPIDSNQPNILMAHGAIEGMPQFKMAELGEQEIPAGVLDRFDYVAMGHYHNCLQVGPRAWYAGSTERLSQAERTSPKGFLEVNLEPLHVKFHEVTCREMIDVPVINAEGLRGDQILDLMEHQLESSKFDGKLARITVDGVSEEAIRTLPRERLAALKERAFDLNVRINREQSAGLPEVGREAAGRLNQGFIEFLKTADLNGMDLERLAQMADRYLAGQD